MGDIQRLRMELQCAESGWSQCSRACAKVQAERDEARATLERRTELLREAMTLKNQTHPYAMNGDLAARIDAELGDE